MEDLPAIAIEGAKAVGKTVTASRRAATILGLTDEAVRLSVAANPDLVTQVPSPVLIDEWQLEPQTWQRVRRAVDDDPRAGGRFLLTGSAGIAPGVRIHSGAGRIVRLTMRPLTIAERQIEQPTVSVRDLHQGQAEISGTTQVQIGDYVQEILRSGFPGIRQLPHKNLDRQLDSYIERIVDSDMPDNGITIRRPNALRAWLRAYAAATSTQADYTKILNAATAGQPNKPARHTVAAYREHLQRLFVLDPVDAWVPAFSPLNRLTVSPKHHLVDPALAARLVGVGEQGLLMGKGDLVVPTTGTWLGALFESLVVQSVRVYSEAINGRIGHLRTKNGDREIDIIVETNNLDCVALEVKLSATITDRDVAHLHWLRHHIGSRLKDAAVITTGPHAYRRPDGVAVIPLALLGP
jgi:predicted AAA+ superfamily ATPase